MFQVVRVRGVNDTRKFQDRECTYWFQLVQKLWHMMYTCGGRLYPVDSKRQDACNTMS